MPITSGAEYIESLRGRNLRVYLFGELVEEPELPALSPHMGRMFPGENEQD